MNVSTLSTTHPTARQRRLKAIVKRLVIELGYLEYCLAEGWEDDHVQTAAVSLDTAIDCLNGSTSSVRQRKNILGGSISKRP